MKPKTIQLNMKSWIYLQECSMSNVQKSNDKCPPHLPGTHAHAHAHAHTYTSFQGSGEAGYRQSGLLPKHKQESWWLRQVCRLWGAGGGSADLCHLSSWAGSSALMFLSALLGSGAGSLGHGHSPDQCLGVSSVAAHTRLQPRGHWLLVTC